MVGGVPHPRSGVAVPEPGLDGGGRGAVPHPGGVPPPSRPGQGTPLGQGTPSIKIWPGYPHLGMGYPPPSRPGQGTPNPGMGYPPDLGWGTPPGWGTHLTWDGVPPQTEQHSEHLLRGGRYASCVHAGGLSCLLILNNTNLKTVLEIYMGREACLSFKQLFLI